MQMEIITGILARIGIHLVEYDFGITRNILNDSSHWDKFFAAQITAIMIHHIMRQFDLRSYIRRLKHEIGCILDPEHVKKLCIDFD
jgi:hypothetical protein